VLEVQTGTSSLRELILSGEFVQGEALPPERELSVRLGVARSSVREAIRELVAIGVLETKRGAGTFVTSLIPDQLFAGMEFALHHHPESILDVVQVRLLLEPAVSALAATGGTAEQVAQLHELVARHRASVTSANELDVVVADEQIHDALLDIQPNVLLRSIVRSLRYAARASRLFTVGLSNSMPESVAELEALVSAVSLRDQLGAQAAMARHISRLLDGARTELSRRSMTDGASLRHAGQRG